MFYCYKRINQAKLSKKHSLKKTQSINLSQLLSHYEKILSIFEERKMLSIIDYSKPFEGL